MPSIYVRVKDQAGNWNYRRIEEGRGKRTGDLIPPFFFRPFVNGKQRWTPLSAQSFQEAKTEAEHRNNALDAHKKGLTVAEAALTGGRKTIQQAVDDYLKLKQDKRPKTISQYKTTFEQFVEALAQINVSFLDQLTNDEAGRNILRHYKKFLENQGYEGKTIDTRINIVNFLLKKNEIKVRLPKDEMPDVEEEPAIPYTEDELKTLFDAMSDEEEVNDRTYRGKGFGAYIRYKFFLGTACRDKEVTYASWSDLDLTGKQPTYTVRKKEDVGFKPKSHESRTIPIPRSLSDLLKERKKNAPHSRWIFVNEDGRPDNHFLRKLKVIAKNAGMNCQNCRHTITEGRWHRVTKEVTCKTHPVCDHIYLHRFRKTRATQWVEHNVPLTKIQRWLGHKDLATTQKYLGDIADSKFQDHIDGSFGD